MSLPAPPDRWSEPWWPRISSLDEPPAFVRLELSRTFHRTPVTAGQPLWLTLAPPPLVWRPLPAPHCTPEGMSRQRSTASLRAPPRRSRLGGVSEPRPAAGAISRADAIRAAAPA